MSTTPPTSGSPSSPGPPGGPGQRQSLPPLFTKREKYYITGLSIAFIIASGIIHFAIGSLGESVVPHFKQEATPPPQKVTVQTLIKPPPKPTPTPHPTPTPTPPPPPKNTPPPVNLKLHVVQSHSSSNSGGPAEQAYTPPPVGNPNGVPTAMATAASTAPPATAPPTPSGPVEATDAVFINKVAPEYPDMAKEESIQGDVTVRITVGPTGSVLAAVIQESSGNPLLDQAALKAARASTFKPPTYNGVAVQLDYLIVYNFRLDQ
ncbi:MAG TPA: TonB family protein [Candidatus Eremiobacteraceae bacterium]|nr:TonB family protein [Candidatus Eremiobacteraceae bacterium]